MRFLSWLSSFPVSGPPLLFSITFPAYALLYGIALLCPIILSGRVYSSFFHLKSSLTSLSLLDWCLLEGYTGRVTTYSFSIRIQKENAYLHPDIEFWT